MLESLETQNADELEEMGKQVFELFKHDFGEFSKFISVIPSSSGSLW